MVDYQKNLCTRSPNHFESPIQELYLRLRQRIIMVLYASSVHLVLILMNRSNL